MNEKQNNPEQEKLNAWIKSQLNAAVDKLTDQGRINSLLIEAKPAWVLPYQILIGKIRAQGESSGFEWFICGDIPTDFLESKVASTPRDVARHFSMKWQLQAARYQALESKPPLPADSDWNEIDQQLAEKAEALYGLVNEPGLWLQNDNF